MEECRFFQGFFQAVRTQAGVIPQHMPHFPQQARFPGGAVKSSLGVGNSISFARSSANRQGGLLKTCPHTPQIARHIRFMFPQNLSNFALRQTMTPYQGKNQGLTVAQTQQPFRGRPSSTWW